MASSPEVVGSEHIVFDFNYGHTPVVMVEPPGSLTIETLDARCGKLRKEEDVYSTTPDFSSQVPTVNPATGPIGVKGARPGDAVMVMIEDIQLDKQGFVLVKPNFGIIDDMVSEPVARIISIKDEHLYFSDNIRVRIRPMVGVIGTAPKDVCPATVKVGKWGGNMDNKRITTGAKVFLPVFVDNALVYLGDVHARMGDGEATGVAAEIGSRVKVKIDLIKNAKANYPYMDNYPFIETDKFIITTGTGPEFPKAARIAVEEMVKKLMQLKQISQEEAYMLICIAGDVRLNQATNSPVVGFSIRVEFPKEEL